MSFTPCRPPACFIHPVTVRTRRVRQVFRCGAVLQSKLFMILLGRLAADVVHMTQSTNQLPLPLLSAHSSRVCSTCSWFFGLPPNFLEQLEVLFYDPFMTSRKSRLDPFLSPFFFDTTVLQCGLVPSQSEATMRQNGAEFILDASVCRFEFCCSFKSASPPRHNYCNDAASSTPPNPEFCFDGSEWSQWNDSLLLFTS